ncbi:MAG: N-acetylmuramoyl-L-alanine amidase [Deltaproteobacteria bacterium]|nr:N-acetylmuramoyl-L-alanine amidase [Deltaproteobacteria bacterium]
MAKFSSTLRIIKAISIAMALVVGMQQPLSAAQSAAELFQDASKAYVDLTRDAGKRKSRANWIKVIAKYGKVASACPKSSLAPKSLYMKGRLYEQLYGYSGKKTDLQRAISTYLTLAQNYPHNSLADDSLYKSARIYELKLSSKQSAYDLYRKIIVSHPDGDMVQNSRERLNALNLANRSSKSSREINDLTLVKGIRQWSDKDYTRVVIDLEKDVPFDTFALPPDNKTNRSHRLVIDLDSARTPKGFPYKMDVNDGILSFIRISQNQKNKVRVVLDLSQKPYYNAFPLENPSRLVVDVSKNKNFAWNTAPSKSASGVQKVKSGVPSVMPSNVPSIAKQLSLKVSRIVIDPGHGGKDPGALGPGGIREKNVALAISKALAQRLQQDGFEVFLTRTSDVFLTLEERTAFANKKKADLFISIHLNANKNASIRGVETFFLNLTTDASAIQVAARENATTSNSLSDLQLILNDLMLNSKINESSRFASCMQKSIMSTVRQVGYAGKDLGVRQAPFYVLLGAQMPSILLELGFITNAQDVALLRKATYQNIMINGIASGINSYIMNTTYAYSGRTQ